MTSTIVNHVNVREMTKNDIPFIHNSAIRCLSQYDKTIFKGWDYDKSCKHLELLILKILTSPNYNTFIACLNGDSDHIVGYIVGARNHIYLQYTKYDYRGLGVQKNLLLPLVVDEAEPISVNWPTKEMLKLRNQDKVIIYNKFVEDLLTNEN